MSILSDLIASNIIDNDEGLITHNKIS